MKCQKEFHPAVLEVPVTDLKNWSWEAYSPSILTVLFYKYVPLHLGILRLVMYQSWTIPCTEIWALESLLETKPKGKLADPKQMFLLRSETQLCSQEFFKMFRICTPAIPVFCTEQQNCSVWPIQAYLPVFQPHDDV